MLNRTSSFSVEGVTERNQIVSKYLLNSGRVFMFRSRKDSLFLRKVSSEL